MNRLSLYQALRDIAAGVITKTLEIQGRIEVALDRLEKLANKEEGQRARTRDRRAARCT